MTTKQRSERMKAIWAKKREASRVSVENDLVASANASLKDGKLKTESVYHLGNQVISVYSSEGRITRFIMNDASNNSFETTIEEA
jgi:hypothetical protein